MSRYVAFLRAINVGGRAIVRMTDLRDAFVAAGCKQVRTYIQSGNVVFESSAKDPSSRFRKIRSQVAILLHGTEPEISFRQVSDIEKIVSAAPFKAFEDDPKLKLYVGFLAERPAAAPVLPLISVKEAVEVIGVDGLEVFMVSRQKKNGFYGFPNNFIEKELGVSSTSRNWTTVTKILDFANTGE